MTRDELLNKIAQLPETIVSQYAYEIVSDAYEPEEEIDFDEVHERLLNGSLDWYSYSEDGNSLIYNSDIAKRLKLPIDTDGMQLLLWQSDYLALAEKFIWLMIELN